MTCGVAALETALDMALAQIHSKGERALSSLCALRFDLKSDSKNRVLTLRGGSGATPSHAGASAQTKAFSIEQLERDFPVKVQRIDHRQSNGGKGKNPGGRGLIMKLEVREALEVSWMTDLTLHRPRISKNCTHGDAGEVLIERQGEIKNLPVLGQQLFNAGDVLTLCSGSGGGYGRETPT
jgi:N-methylhydantoinase B